MIALQLNFVAATIRALSILSKSRADEGFLHQKTQPALGSRLSILSPVEVLELYSVEAD
jgi:hypothetical protein